MTTKLSPAMHRAYELLIEKRLSQPSDPNLSTPYDKIAHRYVSAATMGALVRRGLLLVHEVKEYKTETRSRNGNYNTTRHFEAVYRFPNAPEN